VGMRQIKGFDCFPKS